MSDSSWKIKGSIFEGIDTTAHPRDMKAKGVPAWTGDRILRLIGHLALPAAAYVLSTDGHYEGALAKMGVATFAIAANRKLMLHALDAFYGLRWAAQDVTQMSGIGGYFGAVKVLFFHNFLHTAVTWMLMYANPVASSTEITPREMVGAGTMVVAGLLQTVPSVQLYLFKRQPANAGKLFTKGLFGVARFISTTGHVLRYIGAVILTGEPKFIVPFIVVDYPLMASLCAKETVAYMRTKYKAAYAAYERKVPALFIPGIW